MMPADDMQIQNTFYQDVAQWDPNFKQFLLPQTVFSAATERGLNIYARQRPVDVLYSLLLEQAVFPPIVYSASRLQSQDLNPRQQPTQDRGTEYFYQSLKQFMVATDPQETTILLLHIASQVEEQYLVPTRLLRDFEPR